MGNPFATSIAKLGPDKTAGMAVGATSAKTSDMKLWDEISIPLEQSTIGMPDFMNGTNDFKMLRVCWAGATERTASISPKLDISDVARMR